MPKLLHEDKWEIIWLASAIMTYKLTIESEHKAKELDGIQKTQLEDMKKLNKKIDLIMKHLGIEDEFK